MFGYRSPLRECKYVGGKAQTFFWKGWKLFFLILFILYVLGKI